MKVQAMGNEVEPATRKALVAGVPPKMIRRMMTMAIQPYLVVMTATQRLKQTGARLRLQKVRVVILITQAV